MRAPTMPPAKEVRIENVPDASIHSPPTRWIRITRSCICGSDLWPPTVAERGRPAHAHARIGVRRFEQQPN
jgi:threonine dehydrogenase-like Zn-dependent dehydrogenase